MKDADAAIDATNARENENLFESGSDKALALKGGHAELWDALVCDHCEGTGFDREKYEEHGEKIAKLVEWLRELKGKMRDERQEEFRQRDPEEIHWPSWDNLSKREKLDRVFHLNVITKQEKEMACGTVGIFNGRIFAMILNNDPTLWKNVKQKVGRDFEAVFDEETGDVRLVVKDEIREGDLIYVHDVALIMHATDPTVAYMTRAEWRDHNPGQEQLPTKGRVGKRMTFSRQEVEGWWARRRQRPVTDTEAEAREAEARAAAEAVASFKGRKKSK